MCMHAVVILGLSTEGAYVSNEVKLEDFRIKKLQGIELEILS